MHDMLAPRIMIIIIIIMHDMWCFAYVLIA
jgi:hypothetical protein